MSAAETYAARVDAVVAQRTRLRGSQPEGDLFGGLRPDHPLLNANPRRRLEPNLEIVASYLEPDDRVIDVGGGAGRNSLPLALRCREVVVVEPSATMLAALEASAAREGIGNVRVIRAGWPAKGVPRGSVVLVNHVTYLTREIMPFVEQLERVAERRVLITVGSPPPPSRHRELFGLVYGEAEALVPGHVELMNVLWELGIEPDLRMLPDPSGGYPPSPSLEAAVRNAVERFPGEQWAHWPASPELEARIRAILEPRADELFVETSGGFVPRWLKSGHEVLITWEPRRCGRNG